MYEQTKEDGVVKYCQHCGNKIFFPRGQTMVVCVQCGVPARLPHASGTFVGTKRKFNRSTCILFELLGGFLGYCVSFAFQEEMVIKKLGFLGYVRSIFWVLFPPLGKNRSDDIPGIFFAVWLSVIVGAVLFRVFYVQSCGKNNADDDFQGGVGIPKDKGEEEREP